MGSTTLFSWNYLRTTKRNSYTVMYETAGEQQLGCVDYFVLLKEKVYAVVRCFKATSAPYSDLSSAEQLTCHIIPVVRITPEDVGHN